MFQLYEENWTALDGRAWGKIWIVHISHLIGIREDSIEIGRWISCEYEKKDKEDFKKKKGRQ